MQVTVKQQSFHRLHIGWSAAGTQLAKQEKTALVYVKPGNN